MYFTSIIAFALAAAFPLTVAQDVIPFVGTWSSGSKKVVTGAGFANPANMSFTYPPTTGVSYAFSEDGFYEVARYRFNSNGSQPNCITGVLNWHHGIFSMNPNGSITLTPFGDGFQQIQDPCAAETNFIEGYNTTELLSEWRLYEDIDDGLKLHLFLADGTPVAPLFQVYSTPNMLPTQLLRNVTVTVTSETRRSLFSRANSAAHQWTPTGVTVLVSGVFAIGVASLVL